MNPNKFLVIVTNPDQLNIYKKARITNFLFPLTDFSVGFPITFSISEIEEGYIYINRILDTSTYQKLKELLKDIKENIKGIVFEDFGIITLAKELNLKQKLILYQTHFATNHQSINHTLEYVDSVVISTDITKEEIKEIEQNVQKPLVFLLYGLVPTMYSRRTLMTNFEKHFNLQSQPIIHLKEPISKKGFLAVENKYGTILYHDKYLNALNTIEDKNILFYLINPLFLNKEELENLLIERLINDTTLTNQEDQGFLNQKTIYQLKGDIK